jgi:hypothetical protein
LKKNKDNIRFSDFGRVRATYLKNTMSYALAIFGKLMQCTHHLVENNSWISTLVIQYK